MKEPPSVGDICYVDLAGRGTFEAKVVSAGRDYEVRLLDTEERATVPNSCVWTAPPSEVV